MDANKPLITASLKVGALLDAYPELEQVLVDLAPPFRKLRNPVLRRTVARVTTLAQAARVAGVPLGPLVRALRKAAGQATEDLPPTREEAPHDSGGPVPEWVTRGEIAVTLNADELLAGGVNPLTLAQGHLNSLQPDQVLLIEGSFRPEPLIDLLTRQGRRVHSAPDGTGRYRTFVAHGDRGG